MGHEAVKTLFVCGIAKDLGKYRITLAFYARNTHPVFEILRQKIEADASVGVPKENASRGRS